MDLPQRKLNRIPEYDYSTNGAYFITICTQDRRKILSHIVGGGALDAPVITLSKIGQIVEKYILSSNQIPGISIDKYIIMPDHLHLLVQVNETASFSRKSPKKDAALYFIRWLPAAAGIDGTGFPF